MTILQIQIPDELLAISDESHLEAMALEALLVRLYQQRKISSGRAAATLGIERRDFLATLDRYQVSIFDEAMDLAEEVRRAHDARP